MSHIAAGAEHSTLIGAVHMVLAEYCLCRSSLHQEPRWGRLILTGKCLTQLSVEEDCIRRYCVDCTCLIAAPRACGHSNGPQSRALRGGQAKRLQSLARVIRRDMAELTVFAHGLSICPSKFRSQSANTIVQLLNLRLSKYCSGGLCL